MAPPPAARATALTMSDADTAPPTVGMHHDQPVDLPALMRCLAEL
jgi:hypothetical protein